MDTLQALQQQSYALQVIEIFAFVALGLALPGLCMIGLAWLIQVFLGYHRPNPMKMQTYECGIEPVQDANVQFDIRYYLYALLFIIFDIEVVFLVPLAIATHAQEIKQFGTFLAPIEIAIFVGILAFGLVYAWKKGALEWE